MRLPLALLLAPLVHAAITGTVVNGTSGKPQSGVPINLVQPSQKGMQQLGTATSAADGKFSFDANPTGPGPVLLQATFETVTYSTLLPPNQPRTGVQVLVYDSSAKRDSIAVNSHGVFFEPADSQLVVRELIFINNTGKTAYADNANGTYRFAVPKEVEKINVSITPPSGMPISRPAEKTADDRIRKISFPIRPGQTQFEIDYAVPLTNPLVFSGEILHKEGEVRLIVPRGMALEGEGLEAYAPLPSNQFPVYGIKPGPFTVKITGSVAPPEPEDPDAKSPEVKAHRPRIYDRYWWILGLGLGIMTLSLLAMASRGTVSVPSAAPVASSKKPARKK
jgi:hypothetical protein